MVEDWSELIGSDEEWKVNLCEYWFIMKGWNIRWNGLYKSKILFRE